MALTGHSEPLYSVAISPDGQTLFSGGSDETIKIWRQD
nr:WD40 repeat domain-containing protein [Microcoleus sp. PH2017_40_RAT_O_B]